MKIKNKLTLIFTIIIAVILVCLNLYIYFISKSFLENNFYKQLRDRAYIAATVFLEKDEENAVSIDLFQRKYLITLPNETVRFYNSKNQPVFIDSTDIYTYNESQINQVRRYKEAQFKKGERQILGIYYEDNQGNFVIIVSAVDEVSIHSLAHLEKVLLIGLLLSITLIFFLGRFFTTIMLKPISTIIRRTRQISETNLHLRLTEGNGKDELAKLSITINKMLEGLDNAFSLQKSFVTNASHELRNPLTSIIGNIEITLSKARTTEEYEEILESLMKDAEKLHNLVNCLLTLVQSNTDFSTLKKDEIRLDELIMEIISEMHVKRSGCKINLQFPEMPIDADVFIIMGDKNLLETAFINLVDNACKFSKEGLITISILLNSNNSISLNILDNGIGIAEEELPHITETFYRAPNARSYSGSGIGLALTDRIVKLHRGKMNITSKLNAGTEVSVTFPLPSLLSN